MKRTATASLSRSSHPRVKPKLEKRRLLDEAQATELESTFKTLANTTRLRLLHALVRAGELCVGELAETLGMSSQAISNQLQRLSDRGIVGSTRKGLHVYYYIVDPCVVMLLDRGWCLAEDTAKRVTDHAGARRAVS